MSSNINQQDFLTAQELWFTGGTPDITPKEEKDWYIPQGILRGVLTVKEAIERRTTMHYESFMLSIVLGFSDQSLSMGFAEIDAETRQTVNDPKIIGLWNKKKKKVIEIPGRDLTREAYDIFQGKTDLHLREPKTAKEGGTSSSEQKA